MTTDNYDVDALSNELDSQLSQLDNDINKQMENITYQLDGNNAKKKHKYIIRVNGEMLRVDSMELPNATEERLEEIWEDEEPFVDYINDDMQCLTLDAEDIRVESFSYDEEAESTFKELAGDITEENVRISQYYLNVEKDYNISLHELTDDEEYLEIDGHLNVELPFQLSLGHSLQQNIENTEPEDEELLRELYKKNGFDDSYNQSFFDENLKFDAGKWYLVNMQYHDEFQEEQEYVLETDEEFDETKLIGIYATIDDLDEFNSYLTGLFYDGKLLSLHQSACDDGNGSVNNHIVRYKEGEYGLIIDKTFPNLINELLNIRIMNKFKCTLKADRAGMKKGTVIEVTTSLASCDANNIADACEAKFGKKSRDASHPSYWDIKKV